MQAKALATRTVDVPAHSLALGMERESAGMGRL
jgi:hypothetical protein